MRTIAAVSLITIDSACDTDYRVVYSEVIPAMIACGLFAERPYDHQQNVQETMLIMLIGIDSSCDTDYRVVYFEVTQVVILIIV
ncbi:unnamed protein product [Dibothriocephalus latus]|uniref:Uncharacterized protein n=1 Tax=Dibothriocephalus latus TaxID=60516 RepID=A0A3P6RCB5_DIBLA|nr:unnamed protein product [Dibothriocephalus latus]